MEKIKSALKSLPEVNEIWKTKDGHFHLHPHYGGKKFTREDVEGQAENEHSKEDHSGDGEKVLNSKRAIVRINSAKDEAEVTAFLGNDDRKSVIEAAEKKIASFK